ncbi:hypothetical protein ApDm4_0540 [Acetobacter pomorum]|nr:hypothetical protein ApDm4_0540 [Acetobacter pomorum]
MAKNAHSIDIIKMKHIGRAQLLALTSLINDFYSLIYLIT